MLILEINKNILPVLSFIGQILNLIHIIVPILLIVFVTIDLAKAVLSQDDDMVSKTLRSIRNRVIACLLIFFLPTFVEYIFEQTYISLNMDLEEYNEILKTYRSVINSSDIDATDDTKSKDIEDDLSYSINNESDEEIEKKQKDEQKLADYSKEITSKIFIKKPKKEIKELITTDFNITYKNKKYELGGIVITYDDISIKEVSNNNQYVVSTIMLENAKVNNQDNYDNLIINYYFKLINGDYKLERINIENKDNIVNYLGDSKSSEKANEIIASKKYISNDSNYDYTKLKNLTDSNIKEIYNKNSKNIVLLNTIAYSAIVNRATGFFISNGVIVTSWSYLQNSFIQGQTIVVSDIYDNTYKIDGLVTLDSNNDIAVLKLSKEVNRKVSFSLDTLNKNDPVIAITSKTGVGLTTVTGIVSSSSKDSIISVLPLSKNDWGSPLFNSNGDVIGMNTSKLINSEISNASNIEKLKSLQSELLKVKFKDIKVKKIENIKREYYYQNKNVEEINNSISENIWDKFKNIGNIEETIFLDLIKASYYDNAVSLRYENKTSPYIDTFSYITDFTNELEKQGYKKEVSYNEKILYKKGPKKVIIMEEFNYLIIVLVEGNLL